MKKGLLNTLRWPLVAAVLMLAVCLFYGLSAHATTVDLKTGGTTVMPKADGQVHMLMKEVSFADNASTISDTVELWTIPKGTFVVGVGVVVDTAEGATCTIDVGDATQAAGYFNDLSINATAGTQAFSMPGSLTEATPNTFLQLYAQGKFYTSAGVIKILVNSASTNTAVIRVALIYMVVFKVTTPISYAPESPDRPWSPAALDPRRWKLGILPKLPWEPVGT